MRINDLTEQVIASAIEVHRSLGPGLPESIYEECLCRELTSRRIPFRRREPVPVMFKGGMIESDFRLDLLVAESVVIEVKAVDSLLPIHDAQLLSYMKLGGWKVGLLINFNVPLLKQGIRRRVLGLEREHDICINR